MNASVVLVCGASASGKSRLINGSLIAARNSGVLPGMRIIPRYTTRAARERESLPGENSHLSHEAFENCVSNGTIDVHWRRSIAQGHENRYGFALCDELDRDGMVVLSGNNYLDWSAQPLLAELRAERRLMVVRVWASPETRLDRLDARRPSLTPDELASRMTDVPTGQLPLADHVIPNDLAFQRFAEWEFINLVNSFRFSALGPEEPFDGFSRRAA